MRIIFSTLAMLLLSNCNGAIDPCSLIEKEDAVQFLGGVSSEKIRETTDQEKSCSLIFNKEGAIVSPKISVGIREYETEEDARKAHQELRDQLKRLFPGSQLAFLKNWEDLAWLNNVRNPLTGNFEPTIYALVAKKKLIVIFSINGIVNDKIIEFADLGLSRLQ